MYWAVCFLLKIFVTYQKIFFFLKWGWVSEFWTLGGKWEIQTSDLHFMKCDSQLLVVKGERFIIFPFQLYNKKNTYGQP